MKTDAGSTCTFTHDSDIAWIPSKYFNVVFYPLQGHDLVQQSNISRCTRALAMIEESKGSKPEVRDR